MELVDGVDLKHVLRMRGALPPDEAYDIASRWRKGCRPCTSAGIIHRDLKTPNIMRDRRASRGCMDFGIAKRTEADGARSPRPATSWARPST